MPSSFVSALHPYSARHHLPHPGHFGAALAAIVRSDVGGNIDRLERARRRGKERSSKAKNEDDKDDGDDTTPSPPSSSSSSDPSLRLLLSIPLDEIERGADLGAKSDAKGLLWLKRANDFILLLLRNLLRGTGEEDKGKSSTAAPPMSVSAAAKAAYSDTLRKYHGMLTAAAFSAALSVRGERRER